MNSLKRSLTSCLFLSALLPLLLCSGCISVPAESYKESLGYQPARASERIDSTVAVEATHTLTPELHSLWKKWMNSDQTVENWRQAVAEVIVEDLVQSELFARVQTAPSAPADYRIRIQSDESRDSSENFQLRMTLRLADGTTNQELAVFNHGTDIGHSIMAYDMKGGIQRLMGEFKADLAAEFQKQIRRRQEAATLAETEAMKQAGLADLVVAADRSAAMAVTRNRALIAAKTTQLPDILRNWKTVELTALVVKVEQTVLDLNHECEVLKDKAQQTVVDESNDRAAAAAGRRLPQGVMEAEQARLDEQRGLAISYRERIELLKPILAALKEEIANRGR